MVRHVVTTGAELAWTGLSRSVVMGRKGGRGCGQSKWFGEDWAGPSNWHGTIWPGLSNWFGVVGRGEVRQ